VAEVKHFLSADGFAGRKWPTWIMSEQVRKRRGQGMDASQRPIALDRAPLNSVRIVRACEDYAAHERYRSITLADLCAASGATERRVRHAFSDCFGMSPTSYLRVAALYEAHNELMKGLPVPDPVSRAAVEFGFWHLGRFAAQYRALFGELPHGTVRRARRTRRVARRAA
jgi:AraC-like DNA-binding protein